MNKKSAHLHDLVFDSIISIEIVCWSKTVGPKWCPFTKRHGMRQEMATQEAFLGVSWVWVRTFHWKIPLESQKMLLGTQQYRRDRPYLFFLPFFSLPILVEMPPNGLMSPIEGIPTEIGRSKRLKNKTGMNSSSYTTVLFTTERKVCLHALGHHVHHPCTAASLSVVQMADNMCHR